MKPKLLRKYFAEALGVAVIVATVLGAGFMAENLRANPEVSLVMAALAVGSVLLIMISLLLPISGAHFNPVVTLILAIRKKFAWDLAVPYMLAQLIGAFLGAILANAMFERPLVGINQTFRASAGELLGEVVATAGLIFIILVLLKQRNAGLIAPAVALWIVAGHFFTSSTSFANPAVTIGRALSESASGTDWVSVPLFIAAQLIGGLVGLGIFRILLPKKK